MIYSIIEDAVAAIEDAIREHGIEVGGADLGLDPRALHRGHIISDALVVSASADRSLQYYGGFEYVAAEARVTLGRYVIYLRELDERVDGAFECFEGTNTEDDGQPSEHQEWADYDEDC